MPPSSYLRKRDLALLGIVLLIGLIQWFRFGKAQSPQILAEDSTGQVRPVVIELEGEVAAPGIYYLPEPIELRSLLDKFKIKGREMLSTELLSTKVNSGQRIRISREGERLRVDIKSMEGAKRLIFGLPLDINSATVEELELLPGIGEVISRRIIEFREKNGRFARVEELLKVKGLGPKKLEKIKKLIFVSE